MSLQEEDMLDSPETSLIIAQSTSLGSIPTLGI